MQLTTTGVLRSIDRLLLGSQRPVVAASAPWGPIAQTLIHEPSMTWLPSRGLVSWIACGAIALLSIGHLSGLPNLFRSSSTLQPAEAARQQYDLCKILTYALLLPCLLCLGQHIGHSCILTEHKSSSSRCAVHLAFPLHHKARVRWSPAAASMLFCTDPMSSPTVSHPYKKLSSAISPLVGLSMASLPAQEPLYE